MTTIAVDRGGMACDSRTSWDSDFFVCADKVERLGDDIVGCAGSVETIFKFLHWLKNKGERPDFDSDKSFSAVVLNKSGIYFYDNSTYSTKVCQPCFSIGSGGMAAQAAMLCGKTPAEAVAIAIKCDKNSGGPVRSFQLKGD